MSYSNIFQLQAPKLQNKFGGFAGLGKQMNDMSDAYTSRQDQLKVNADNNAFRDKGLKLQAEQLQETKNQNLLSNKHKNKVYKYGVTRDAISDNQWEKTFNKPNVLSTDQVAYYNAKTEDLKIKQASKLMTQLQEMEAYQGMNESDQLLAQKYIKDNGKLPNFEYDNSFFGKGYHIAKPKLDGRKINLGL